MRLRRISSIYKETYPYEVSTSLLITVIKPEQIPKKSAEDNRFTNKISRGEGALDVVLLVIVVSDEKENK
jgi:hypothetical protein